uniref:Uncharacterized protein n=1 Tax=Arundo donax TaxID=35708 RepID=A0A0A9BHS7_ARUDO
MLITIDFYSTGHFTILVDCSLINNDTAYEFQNESNIDCNASGLLN